MARRFKLGLDDVVKPPQSPGNSGTSKAHRQHARKVCCGPGAEMWGTSTAQAKQHRNQRNVESTSTNPATHTAEACPQIGTCTGRFAKRHLPNPPKLCHFWRALGRAWPSWANFGPTWTSVGQHSAKSGQHWPTLGGLGRCRLGHELGLTEFALREHRRASQWTAHVAPHHRSWRGGGAPRGGARDRAPTSFFTSKRSAPQQPQSSQQQRQKKQWQAAEAKGTVQLTVLCRINRTYARVLGIPSPSPACLRVRAWSISVGAGRSWRYKIALPSEKV